MHEEEILDHLDLMLESIELVEERFSRVRSAEDFVLSSSGATLLDAITMRLQVIGESVRKIQKLDPSFLSSKYDRISRNFGTAGDVVTFFVGCRFPVLYQPF